MSFLLKIKDVSDQIKSLIQFHQHFSKFFQTRTRSVEQSALEYMKGLLIVETEKTMAQMERRLDDVCKQKLGHFISNSPWDDKALIQEIQKCVVTTINPNQVEDGALIIDESSMAKKGKESVGVKRQYAGSLGKVDNCQVGVFLAYATASQTSLIARDLYLPKDWIEDPERCFEAGIPIENQNFRTKAEIALDLVKEAIASKIAFSFIHMDAHYGVQPWLLESFDDMGITWFADVSKDTLIYEKMPSIEANPMGDEKVRLTIANDFCCSVQELLNRGSIKFQKRKIRDVQRGILVVEFAKLRVFINSKDRPIPRECSLLIRRELDGSCTKFTLSNSPKETDAKTLSERQSRRYWVERALQDAKGLVGLDQYRVTGWRGWQHHTAMVMLAMLFLLTIKNSLVEKADKMSLKDALWLVEAIVPRKQLTYEETLAIIRENHENRERSRQARLEAQLKSLEGCEVF
jgi:SRSO17 transposase